VGPGVSKAEPPRPFVPGDTGCLPLTVEPDYRLACWFGIRSATGRRCVICGGDEATKNHRLDAPVAWRLFLAQFRSDKNLLLTGDRGTCTTLDTVYHKCRYSSSLHHAAPPLDKFHAATVYHKASGEVKQFGLIVEFSENRRRGLHGKSGHRRRCSPPFHR
jgi:hypothetical protein